METNKTPKMDKALKLAQHIMANMKTSDEEAEYKEPAKHTPTPFYNLRTKVFDANGSYIALASTKVAKEIVTACNSYEALKQQNEELIEQTTKLQADKDKLALMLERIHLMFLNRDMRETSAVIKQTLSECGYNI